MLDVAPYPVLEGEDEDDAIITRKTNSNLTAKALGILW